MTKVIKMTALRKKNLSHLKHLSCGLETGKATIHAVIQFVDYDGKSGFHFLVNVSTHAYFGLTIVNLPLKFTKFGEIGHCVKEHLILKGLRL